MALPFFEELKKGEKFFLKFKISKRWKFKAFRFESIDSVHCDCCGFYTIITIQKGGRSFTMDNHFGENFLNQLKKELIKTNSFSKCSF